jgi:recombination protein RecA
MRKTTNKFAPKLRERAVRMVLDHEGDHPFNHVADPPPSSNHTSLRSRLRWQNRGHMPQERNPGKNFRSTLVLMEQTRYMALRLKSARGHWSSAGGNAMAANLKLVEGKQVDADRQKALDAALAQIDRAFGKGSAMKLGQKETMQVETISSGSLGLDIALGVGGLPKGRVIEVYGPESSGKTTLALHVIAEAQKNGGTAAFVDAEHALDPVYAKKLGVDIDELIVSQPDTGEQALEITDTLVRSNAIDVLVVDSVAALVPRAEIEGEMGDSHVGLQARLMSQSLRKLTGSINRSKCMVIFINQLRMKIGVMYGNPETTTGGNALKFYASVRLDIRRTGQIKDRDEIIGNTTRVKVVKNKVAPPFKQVEFDIMYGEGISKIGEILDLGVKAGVVEKSGSWFSYDSVRIGQGRENAKQFLKENPEMCAKLEAAIRGRTSEVAGEMMAGPDADED